MLDKRHLINRSDFLSHSVSGLGGGGISAVA